ncbi:MAG: hypothetical protein R6X02_01615 [Enhygromyxa sp.]
MTTAFGIVIAAEAESDARRIKSLVDAILVAEIEWLAEQPEQARDNLLDDLRKWRSFDSASSFLDIHKIHDFADARGLPSPRGHFDGRPAAQDYHSALRALWLLIAEGRPPALIWVRDTDGQIARIKGWTDACSEAGADFPVLIGGFPHECMEAWLLVAHSVDRRKPEFAQMCQRLGFNPLEHPERLSHKDHAPKSAKRVCKALGVSDERWLDANPEDLAQRGAGCGLAEFIGGIRDELVPAVKRP